MSFRPAHQASMPQAGDVGDDEFSEPLVVVDDVREDAELLFQGFIVLARFRIQTRRLHALDCRQNILVRKLVFRDVGKGDDTHHRLFDREMKAQQFVEAHQDVMHDVPLVPGRRRFDDGLGNFFDFRMLGVDFIDTGEVLGVRGGIQTLGGRILICARCRSAERNKLAAPFVYGLSPTPAENTIKTAQHMVTSDFAPATASILPAGIPARILPGTQP